VTNYSDIIDTIGLICSCGNLFCLSLQTLLLCGTLLYARGQINAARNEQRLGAMWEIFNELDFSGAREARKFVYDHRELYKSLEGNNVEKFTELSKEAHANAERVSNSFDRIGYVVSLHLIPEELILKGYYIMIGKCWFILRPYIKIARRQRRKRDFQVYFQSLGEAVFSKYSPEEEIRQMLYNDLTN
jgi:hypothetical protein